MPQNDAPLSAAVLELLASRICHDLISPVGAINNGIEFLEEAGAAGSQDAIGLIAHSARQASVKLQAFRLAYGAGGRDPNLKPEDVKKTFEALIEADGKIAQSWNPHANLGFSELPTGFCKILMGSMMLGAECLPKGGRISVSSARAGETLITAEGTDAVVRAQVEEALARQLSPDDLDPRLVHPYAMGALSSHYGFTLRFAEKAPGKIVIALSR